MISKELSETLGFAVREAKKRRHEYVCVEHVLFAILYDSEGIEIIENCGGNVENLKNALESFFGERMESIPEGDEYVLQQTVGFQRVIQRAMNHVRSAEKQEVDVSDILASIFQEKDSHAEYFLKRRYFPSGCFKLHFPQWEQVAFRGRPASSSKPDKGRKRKRPTPWRYLPLTLSKAPLRENWIL